MPQEQDVVLVEEGDALGVVVPGLEAERVALEVVREVGLVGRNGPAGRDGSRARPRMKPDGHPGADPEGAGAALESPEHRPRAGTGALAAEPARPGAERPRLKQLPARQHPLGPE